MGWFKKTVTGRSEYAKNIITLFSGTAIAQAIIIAATPILSRLYTPSDFGDLTLVLSIINILSVLATGRYELAVLLPKNDEWAKQIIRLAFTISAIFSIFVFLIVIVFHDLIVEQFHLGNINNVLYWLPLILIVNANLGTIIYWANRKRKYKHISVNKIVEGIITTIVNMICGFFIFPKGLVFGRFSGQFVSLLFYVRQLQLKDFTFSKIRMTAVAKRYIDFPKYLIIAHFFNTAAFELPALILNSFYGNSVLGFFGFSNRIATAPLSLMSSSLGNVFRETAARDYIQNGECIVIYRHTLKALIKISIIPFTLFFFFAPSIFSFAFGVEWIQAGYYAQYLTPMYFFQFISSPVSHIFLIAEKQKLDLIWQICLFILNLTVLSLGGIFLNIKYTLMLFSSGYSLMYCINLIYSYRLSKGEKFTTWKESKV